MLKKFKANFTLIILFFVAELLSPAYAQNSASGDLSSRKAATDTIGELRFPFKDEGAFDYPNKKDSSALFLSQPQNITHTYEYDPVSGQYIMYEKVGTLNYRLPKSMSLEEYVKYDFDKSIEEYWSTRKSVESMETQGGKEARRSLIPQLNIKSEAFSTIFGSNTIDIKTQGFVEVKFGYEKNYINDPNRPERLRKVGSFDFSPVVNMSVTGKIGDAVDMKVNFNTEATFDYENKANIQYSGKEDQIVRRIELGNVSLPLNGTLIQGGTNLLGIKTELQFGKLNVTTIVSQNKGQSQVINTEGGAQSTSFELDATEYDENRHFFLSKYFRDTYNKALSMLPIIQSQVLINKVEVWVTNKSNNYQQARNILGLIDLGEPSKYIYNTVPAFGANASVQYPASQFPHNEVNNMYSVLTNNYAGLRASGTVNQTLSPFEGQNFKGGQDWEKVEQARKLNTTEYIVNTKLGYISLTSPLNSDEVLAVAYNYTANGVTYQVGEFSTDGIDAPNNLVVKLLKGTNFTPSLPTWDLMMKNIYNLGAYEMSKEDFQLNIVYQNDSTGSYINYLPNSNLTNHILLRVMSLDKLNNQQSSQPEGDGVFDYVEGLTAVSQSGRIIFPVIEPFGATLRDSITEQQWRDKYVYASLYNSSKTDAEQDAEHNKFKIIGKYKGAGGAEISLNSFNLTPGSVKVSAGGRILTENEQYTVDYTLGRVKIIDSGLLESGTPIQVSTESQDLFSMKRKTMLGSYATYQVSDKLNVGGTLLYMNERPITNKVSIGEEPVSNLMLGADLQYRNKSKFITDMVNYLPFFNSKTESSYSFEGEVAKLFSGQSSVIKNAVYIDDFEGAETPYELKTGLSWSLASTPQGQEDMFPEASLNNDLAYGYNRAKFAWYNIDPIFTRNVSQTPAYIKADPDLKTNHYTREISVKEIYPGKDIPYGSPTTMYVLNLAYYPREKGPYNYDSDPTAYSRGIDYSGYLNDPSSRWGGIERGMTVSNFETANIEFIEFWMLDPFIYDSTGVAKGGDLYFNLGNISEDILKDSRKSFENGLPTSSQVASVDTTAWGRVSTQQLMVHSFDNNETSRQYQDVGLDGLDDNDERSFFKNYLDKVKNIVSPETYNKITADPSSDNYHYFRGTDFDEQKLDILERYKNYNNPQGNTPTQAQSPESYETVGSSKPDIEDINEDNTLSEFESYYQYKVSIRPQDLVVGKNYIVDKMVSDLSSDSKPNNFATWYQFKIPIRTPDKVIGNIRDFKSIRFMRLFMKDFTDATILRMATLDLIRTDWRKYTKTLAEPGVPETAATQFDVTTVNIEENSTRKPVNYVLPPSIDREVDPSNPQTVRMNEQAMLLKVIDLNQGDSRAVYKSLGLDMRRYKRLIMDIHAEEIEGYPLNDDDISIFVRLGSDYNYNYYEYEIPLKLTEPGVYNTDRGSDRLVVWPNENRLDIGLDIFSSLKEARNAEVRKAGSTLRQSDLYSSPHNGVNDNKNTIMIKGNPNLSEVDVMMIGIRSNKNSTNTLPKSAIVWVNELRMSDMEQSGGWASNSRFSLRLSDLGSVSVAGGTQSVGWGSIDQSVTERNLDDKYQVDVAANVELGKLLPQKLGVKLPVFYGYSRSVATPEYNPLDPDIKMKDILKTLEDPAEKAKLKAMTQTFAERKSFNVTNVMIEPERTKPDRKPRMYDVENFSMSYSHNEQLKHDINVESDIQSFTKGGFNYNFNGQPKAIEPFKKVKFLKGKAFSLIRDFNFYLKPKLIAFRTDLSHTYNEKMYRDNTSTSSEIAIPTSVQRDFLWNRYFDLRYDLANSLQFDFSTQNRAKIDELQGIYQKSEFEQRRDTILQNLFRGGRPIDYHHTLNISYRLPINKLPLLEWVSSDVRYSGSYDWLAGPVTADTINIGNTVQNGNNISLNGSFNFTSLYNKVPYFQKVESKYQSSGRYSSTGRRPTAKTTDKSANERTKEVKFVQEKVDFKKDVPRSIFHKLGTDKVKVEVISAKGDTIVGTSEIVNENRINFTVDSTLRGATVKINGTVIQGEPFAQRALDFTTRLLLGVRSARATYSLTGGTVLPGFLPTPKLFGGTQFASSSIGVGANSNSSSSLAPTIPFLMGWQDEDFGLRAARMGWVSKDTFLQSPYLINTTRSYTFNVQLEPIPDIRIDLSANQQASENSSRLIQFSQSNNDFNTYAKSMSGSFSMSIITISSSFEKIKGKGVQTSSAFEKFKSNRLVVAKRLASQRGVSVANGYDPSEIDEITKFPKGYGPTAQEVLIPSFLAAYTGVNASKISLSAFPSLAWVRPNWRINYNGNPSSIDWMKSFITSLNFSHNYQSTYSVGGYVTNLNWQEGESGLSWVQDKLDNFVSLNDINAVTITESYSPLINVDIGFVNSLNARAEFKKQRMLSLSFSNNQLNEMMKNEFTFGVGYRFTGMDMIIKTKRKSQSVSNDVNLRLDLTTSNTKTTMRSIVDTDEPQLSAGSKLTTARFTADYMLSEKFSVEMFYDLNINNPYLASQYYNRHTKFGFSFKFSLLP